jgi:hypothetical protein
MSAHTLRHRIAAGTLPAVRRPGRAPGGHVYFVKLADIRTRPASNGRAQPAPLLGVEALMRRLAAEAAGEAVAERMNTILAEVAAVAREAVRLEVEALLRDLPTELIKVVGRRAHHLEVEARRCQAEAERLAAARHALDEHRAEMSAVAARTAARARGR